MAAGVYNLVLEQGVTYRAHVTVKTNGVILDLTGYHARLQFRTAVTASTTILDLTDVVDGGLTIDGAAGAIDILITAPQTDVISAAKAVYDLEIYAPNGDVTRLLKGSVTFDAQVTR